MYFIDSNVNLKFEMNNKALNREFAQKFQKTKKTGFTDSEDDDDSIGDNNSIKMILLLFCLFENKKIKICFNKLATKTPVSDRSSASGKSSLLSGRSSREEYFLLLFKLNIFSLA